MEAGRQADRQSMVSLFQSFAC